MGMPVICQAFPRPFFSSLRDQRQWCILLPSAILIGKAPAASKAMVGPRHRRRIIAAAVGVGCQKEGGVGSFFLEKDEEKRG